MNATPEQFAAEVDAKIAAMPWYPARFVPRVRQLGAVAAAKELVATGQGKVQGGLTELALRGRLDLSVERLMQLPPYRHLFSRLELQEAERRAGPPPRPEVAR